MATTYTHQRFADECAKALSGDALRAVENRRGLYITGAHGPDILFYYHASLPGRVSALGSRLHRESARGFFENARLVWNTHADREGMLAYLLATNAGEAITMICALIFFGSQLLTPIQILWVNLVTDSLLVIPLGLEPPEAAVLRQKPEAKDAPILSTKMIIRMCVLSVLMASVTMLAYYLADHFLDSHAQANTIAFTALVVMQWSGALTSRGIFESVRQRLKVRHASFGWALLAAIILQLLALFGPLAIVVETVAVPPLALLFTAILAFLIPLVVMELLKKLLYRGSKSL